MLPKFELAPILMYLMMLPNTRAALDHAVFQHQQALLQQDDVGGLLGDVDRRIDRNADIGGLQRRAVVDAVAEEADDMPVPVQRAVRPTLQPVGCGPDDIRPRDLTSVAA